MFDMFYELLLVSKTNLNALSVHNEPQYMIKVSRLFYSNSENNPFNKLNYGNKAFTQGLFLK